MFRTSRGHIQADILCTHTHSLHIKFCCRKRRNLRGRQNLAERVGLFVSKSLCVESRVLIKISIKKARGSCGGASRTIFYRIICYEIHHNTQGTPKALSYFEVIKGKVVTEKNHEVMFACRLRSSHSWARHKIMEFYGQFEPLADFTSGVVTLGQCSIEGSVGRNSVCNWLCVLTEPHFDDWNQISTLHHESFDNVTELSRYNKSK